MSWVDTVKEHIPDWAKDTRLNLDAVINRSTLDPIEAQGCALAAAVTTANQRLIKAIVFDDETEMAAAKTAAAIMANNNNIPSINQGHG